jgi:hypothetical protein
MRDEIISEVWREIPGTSGMYEASNHGRIRSTAMQTPRVGRRRGRVLVQREVHKGYLACRLSLGNGVAINSRVHRYVAAAFLGPCPDGWQVNHKDGDKKNNRPENLEYTTCRENIRHCWTNGMHGVEHTQGERNNHAKLTADVVRAIRERSKHVSMTALGKEYGVTTANVSAIVNRKTWKHI